MLNKKPNQKINCKIIDWDNKEVLLPQSVLDTHLIDSGHLEAYNYIDDLKNKLKSPDNVVASKNRSKTKIANIKLEGKNFSYLHVVVRYNKFFSKLLGKKNFIVTFYAANEPKKGKILWKSSK